MTAEPVIKWAGGKRRLIPVLTERLQGIDCKGRYFEPFIGGGALFLAGDTAPAVINDSNPAVADMYRVVAAYPETLIEQLGVMEELYNEHMVTEESKKDYYLKIRNRFNRCPTRPVYQIYRTADLIFLNKCCFNGLYRENAKGEFNVPWGKKTTVRLCDPDNIRAVRDTLYERDTRIQCRDFADSVREAEKGDLVFMDPPYHGTFAKYSGKGFDERDQLRVFETFEELTDRGCRVITTNSNDAFIAELYKGYRQDVLHVRRNINRDGTGRTGTELLIDNGVKI